jgi:hypothetical protein
MIAPELVELACYSAGTRRCGPEEYEFDMQADVPADGSPRTASKLKQESRT